MKSLIISVLVLFCWFNNGYSQWEKLDLNTSYNLYSIQLLDSNTIYIGGDSGIFKTIDQGINWGFIPVDDSARSWESRIYDLYFFNDNEGVVIGNIGSDVSQKVLKTFDGGNIWEIEYENYSGSHFNDLFFLNENLGWAVGTNGKIIKTTSKGNYWSKSSHNGSTGAITGIHFFDELFGVTTGIGTFANFHRTHNGGSNWTNISIQYNLYSVFISDTNTAYAVGGDGLILKTVNKGITWVQQESYTKADLYDIYFTDPQTGYIAGREGILTTRDGVLWEPQDGSRDIPTREIKFLNKNLGVAVGENGEAIITQDGGGLPYPIMNIEVNEEQLCVGDTFKFTNTGPTFYTYEWFLDGTHYSDAYDTAFVFQTDGVKNISVAITNGYVTDTFNITIESHLYPKSQFSASDSLLNVQFENESELNRYSYWDFGDGSSDNNDSPLHQFPASGTYNVCLFTGSKCGLNDTLCKDVSVSINHIPYTFENLISHPTWDNDWERGAKVISCRDNEILISGTAVTFNAGDNGDDAFLIKTDRGGNFRWIRSFGFSTYDVNVIGQITHSDSTNLFSYYRGKDTIIEIVEIDNDGNVFQTKTFRPTNTQKQIYGTSIDENSRGEYTIFGMCIDSDNTSRPSLFEFDKNLNFLSSISLDFNSVNDFSSIAGKISDDSSYVIAALSSGQRKMYVTKLDDNKNIQWSLEFNLTYFESSELNDLEILENGNIVLIGHKGSTSNDNTFVINLNPAGFVNWYRSFKTRRGFSLLPNGNNVYVGCQYRISMNEYFMLAELDQNGEILWSQILHHIAPLDLIKGEGDVLLYAGTWDYKSPDSDLAFGALDKSARRDCFAPNYFSLEKTGTLVSIQGTATPSTKSNQLVEIPTLTQVFYDDEILIDVECDEKCIAKKPSLALNGGILEITPYSENYQWYKDGVLISSDTSNSFQVENNGSYFVIIEDSNRCSAQSNSIDVLTVYSEQQQILLENEINVYPNPSTKKYTLFLKNVHKETQIILRNIVGQTIDVQTHRNKQQFDFEISSPPGIYFAELQFSDGTSTTVKLVKK